MTDAAQHEVFSRFTAGCRILPNWVGVTTRREFFVDDLRFVTVTPPPPDFQDGVQTWLNSRLAPDWQAARPADDGITSSS